MSNAEQMAVKILAALLDLVDASFLHKTIDEQAEIRAARAAADVEATAKFGEAP